MSIRRVGNVSGVNAAASCFAVDAKSLKGLSSDKLLAVEQGAQSLFSVNSGFAVFQSVLGSGAQGLYVTEQWLCLVDPHEDEPDSKATEELRLAASTKPDKEAMDACESIPVASRVLAIGNLFAVEMMADFTLASKDEIVPVPLWGDSACGYFVAVPDSEYLVTTKELALPSWSEKVRVSYIFSAKRRHELAFESKIIKRRRD